MLSYGERLRQLADSRGSEVAFTFVGGDNLDHPLTWRELHTSSDAVVPLLLDAGAEHGGAVAVALVNCREHIVATWAAWKIGAWVLPLRHDMPAFELDRVLALAQARTLVSEEDRASPPCRTVLRGDIGEATTTANARKAPANYPPPPIRCGISSGGSTGLPKIVMFRGPGIYRAGEEMPIQFRELWRWAPERVSLIAGPLYHGVAFQSAMWGALEGQRQVVLERFDPEVAIDVLERHRIGQTTLVPTMMLRMLRTPGLAQRDLSQLVSLSHTGASCPEWVKRGWMDLIGPENVFEGYGSSEGIGGTSIDGVEWERRPGSVGRPYRTDVEIRDDHGRQLPPGEVGNVMFRRWDGIGPEHEYLGAPKLETDEDGYLTVGDLGWLDEEGYLYIADRRVDMIVTGGANVYPAEVEAVLLQCPGVRDAVVIGLPDPEWGRRVHAVVVPTAGTALSTQAVRSFVATKLSPYKVPKSVEVVEDLPRNDMGKINRGSVAQARLQVTGA